MTHTAYIDNDSALSVYSKNILKTNYDIPSTSLEDFHCNFHVTAPAETDRVIRLLKFIPGNCR